MTSSPLVGFVTSEDAILLMTVMLCSTILKGERCGVEVGGG